LNSISVPNAGNVYEITGLNARLQKTSAKYNTVLSASYGYDQYGFPSSSVVSIYDYVYFQKFQYSFDPCTGNLQWRKDLLKNLTESFTYDNLDRLTQVNGPSPLAMSYAANGNLMEKTDVSSLVFSYNIPSKPYAHWFCYFHNRCYPGCKSDNNLHLVSENKNYQRRQHGGSVCI
jgi:hypothetical protein